MPYYYRRKKNNKKESNENDKPKVKRRQDYVGQLDRIFSLYIRLRDAMYGGYTKCISCGRILEFSRFDCGHYHSRIHISTRWDDDNCNSECQACNRFSAEHLIGYRENLIKKIGEQRFKMLDVKAHMVSKEYDEFTIKLLIQEYKKKVAILAKEKGIDVKS